MIGDDARHTAARHRMVDEQLAARGITDERVLAAMRAVPRHRFVPWRLRGRAHEDGPLEIGWGQTISQPWIVAAMSQALELTGSERVLEVGTGSGYQTAVLARLVSSVFTIEVRPALARRARRRLEALGVTGVEFRCGDGCVGWPEAAPFDGILAAAAAPQVPPRWLAQLAPGGRLVAPVGGGQQELVRLRRGQAGGLSREVLAPVRFVPLVQS
jgi:protein-L-isoaspartate(D-aspartate) O-methyltransferase